MHRPTTASRVTRITAALVGAAGAAVTVAGCAAATTSNAEGTGAAGTSGSHTAGTGAPDSRAASGPSTAQYDDGTYSASGTYQTPQSVESITVSLTLSNDTVTAVKVSGNPRTSETVHYQGEFIAGISSAVVGKKIEDLSITRVGGSSLTSAGFNDALAKIEAEAKA